MHPVGIALKGRVSVYEYSAGNWSQLGSPLDGEAAGDLFTNVTLSADGNRLAVGAVHNDNGMCFLGHSSVCGPGGCLS